MNAFLVTSAFFISPVAVSELTVTKRSHLYALRASSLPPFPFLVLFHSRPYDLVRSGSLSFANETQELLFDTEACFNLYVRTPDDFLLSTPVASRPFFLSFVTNYTYTYRYNIYTVPINVTE